VVLMLLFDAFLAESVTSATPWAMRGHCMAASQIHSPAKRAVQAATTSTAPAAGEPERDGGALDS
jgi:hypothetical protein